MAFGWRRGAGDRCRAGSTPPTLGRPPSRLEGRTCRRHRPAPRPSPIPASTDPSTPRALRAGLARCGTVVARHAAGLTRLDAVLGDGDHGDNLVIGFRAVDDLLAELPAETPPGDILRAVGHRLVAAVGGASGPLYGTACIEAGFVAGDAPILDGPTVAAMLRAAADGLARRGRCRPGDKTILDTLEPAADGLRAEPSSEATSLGAAWGSAVAGRRDRDARHARPRRPARSRDAPRRAVGRASRPGCGLLPPAAVRAGRPVNERASAPGADRDAGTGESTRIRGRPTRGGRPVRPVPAQPARWPPAGRSTASAGPWRSRRGALEASTAVRSGSGTRTGPGSTCWPRSGATTASSAVPPPALADLDAGRAWASSLPGARALVLSDDPPTILLCLWASDGREPDPDGVRIAQLARHELAVAFHGARLRETLEQERGELTAVVDGTTDLIVQVDARTPGGQAQPRRRATPRCQRGRRDRADL